jgi:putative CocE/NonD family hydrolase
LQSRNCFESKFFNCQLKGDCDKNLPEAFIFDSGKLKWSEFAQWPPENIGTTRLNLSEKGVLSINGNQNAKLKFNYVSDPINPVPYRSETEGLVFTPRAYMTDDQRHCSERNDVLTFQTEILGEDFTLTGEILAKLQVAIDQTDADFIVKIIDVFPEDHPPFKHLSKNIKAGGYQMLVRSEIMRGRFRESFENPKAFEKNKKTAVNITLQDIHHTFKKGHRVMIQLQSSCFPLFDRNPQTFVPNIYKADDKDFKKAKITIFGDSEIIIGNLK